MHPEYFLRYSLTTCKIHKLLDIIYQLNSAGSLTIFNVTIISLYLIFTLLNLKFGFARKQFPEILNCSNTFHNLLVNN